MTQLPIIALTGPAGIGKDSLAEALRTQHGFVVLAHAAPLKGIVRDLWNVPNDVLWGPSELRSAPIDGVFVSRCANCGCTVPPEDIDGEPGADGADCGVCKTLGACRIVPLTVRAALQFVGTEIGRNLDPNVWVRVLGRRIDAIQKSPYRFDRDNNGTLWPPFGFFVEDAEGQRPVLQGIVVTDTRFDNEADALRGRGAFIVHLQRGSGWPARGVPGGIAGHASEGGVAVDSYDLIVSVPWLAVAVRRDAHWTGVAIDLVRRSRQ